MGNTGTADEGNVMRSPKKLGFIGGGLNSAVGYTHYLASRMDGLFDVVAGYFSRDAQVNAETAHRFGVTDERCYPSLNALMNAERGNLDAVCVLTPTPDHAETAIDLLQSGFNVVCEKALATSFEEGQAIHASLDQSDQKLMTTFNYVGYPMVREARTLIADGVIGKVQQIYCEMPQESFARKDTNPQDWRRNDYAIPCVSLDLGVHVCHLTQFLLGEDDFAILSAWEGAFGRVNGVIDTVTATVLYSERVLVNWMWSKATLGYTNGLKFRVFGDEGALEWTQDVPDILVSVNENGVRSRLERGQHSLRVASQPRYNRFKAGHPAGFVEAFANIYDDFHRELSPDSESAVASPFSASVAVKGLDTLSRIHEIAKSAR